jgi:hypothetical protein
LAGEIEWLKLPPDLQHRFFELAEEESKRLSRTIEELEKHLEGFRQMLEKHFEPLPEGSPLVRVAAVDSSRSPRLSERLGVRYGVFAAGITYLRGGEREEAFRAGVFKRRQALSPDKSRFFFDLLTAYVERKLALEALQQADLVIVDGSFFGFLYQAMQMQRGGLYGEADQKLVHEVYSDTSELLKSGKAIGVIKRSHTRAIGGYLALKNVESPLTYIIDKLILSLVMPPKTVFDYHRLIGDVPVPVYSYLARLREIGWPENPLEEAKSRVCRPFEDLKLDPAEFNGLRRLQVRAHHGAPPCEIEYPTRVGKLRLLQLIGQPNFFNEVTNLPIALDLVDSMVNLPAKFTDEFVAEVEGRVLELIDKNKGNMDAVKVFFTLLNPQKQF